MFGKNDRLVYLPQIAQSQDLMSTVQDMNPDYGVELLALYQDGTHDQMSSDQMLQVYNRLRSISSMAGIRYFSTTRKKMRTLLEESYVVTAPRGGERIPDPIVSQIPARSTIAVVQRDTTFGKNTYSIEYTTHPGQIMTATTNVTTMRYLALPFIRPGGFSIHIVCFPRQDRILFYGLISVRTTFFLNIPSVRKSFYNRIKAMYTWFASAMAEQH